MKTMKAGDRVLLCDNSKDLWIEGYDVNVNTYATVMKTPKINDKKVLLLLDSIGDDSDVSCLVKRSKIIY